MSNTLTKNIETFLGCDSEYEPARAVLFSMPLDFTTSFRPGTRFASRVVQGDSFGLETYSPYQDKDLMDISVFNGGDLELCFGDTQKALAQTEEFVAGILEDGKLPAMIGGEHLVTLGAVQAMVKEHPDLYILYFDAYANLREGYLGAILPHAAMPHRCWDLVDDGKIFQLGIRSGDRSEFLWGRQHVSTRKFNFEGLGKTVTSSKGKLIYVTIDLDVLDSPVFLGTGTSESGGVSPLQLLHVMPALKGLNVVGCNVNKLSPVCNQSGASTTVTCEILWELLLMLVPASDEKRRDQINRS